MRLIFMTVLFLVSSHATADVSNVDARLRKIQAEFKACDERASSTASMNECRSQMLTKADGLLNEVYRDRVATLRARAEEEKNEPEYNRFAAETLDRMIKAERAWITFRDTECSFQSTLFLNGSGEGTVFLGCLAQMTFERVTKILQPFGEPSPKP